MNASVLLPGFDHDTGLLMLPWWMAATIAAFLVTALVMAMLRGGLAIAFGGIATVAFLGATAGVVWFGSMRLAERERVDERQALLTRQQALAAQAAAPGSMLACLDAVVGETVEAACEKALFGSAEAVASAAAYTTAQIVLLADGVNYALRTNVSSEGILPGLRAALEEDRFGFAAQVLAARYGCSPEHCDAFTLVRDTARLTSNLQERPYEANVTRYAGGWQAPGSGQVRTVRPLASSGASPVPPGFNVPSAASIPAVSIMVPESTASVAPSSGATAAASPPAGDAAPGSSAPARRAPPTRQARPAHPPPAPPVQISPPAPAASPQSNTGSGGPTGQ